MIRVFYPVIRVVLVLAMAFSVQNLAAQELPADAKPESDRVRLNIAIPKSLANAKELVPFLPAPGEKEQKILDTLNEDVETNFVDTPLIDAIQYLGQLTELPIILDAQALDDEGIPADEPINLALAGVSLKSTLKLVLDDLGLTPVIEDEVLKITTKSKAAKRTIVRVYPVGDLVDSSDGESWQELIDVIKSAIPDGQWEKGDVGSISSVRRANSLVVMQTHSAQERVVELLRSLRLARMVALKESLVPPDVGSAASAGATDRDPKDTKNAAIVIELKLDERVERSPVFVTVNGKTEPIAAAVARIQKLDSLRGKDVQIRAGSDVAHKDMMRLIDALQFAKARVIRMSVLKN